jgi:outer membrane protein assembly factor BamB
MLKRRLLVLPAVAVCWAVVSARAEDWPRFRGPNGTGTSQDKNIPVQFGAESIVWKAAIPGLGNSSPVVRNGKVYLESALEDGSKRLLICLDAATGRQAWQREIAAQASKTHKKNTLASSTPATDEKNVYAVFWDGKNIHLHAYTLDGKPVWQRDLGAWIQGRRGNHGAGLSPVVYGGRVFVNNDQDDTAALLAFDAASGKPLWKAPRKAFGACYSSPFLLERPGEPARLICGSTQGLSAYDPAGGKETWKWEWDWAGTRMPLRTVGSPIYHQGMVFLTSGDGAGDRAMAAVPLGGDKPAWEEKRSFPYVPTMLVKDDYIYWVNDRGIAACYVARTGQPVWTERLGGDMTASPVMIDGKIYAFSEQGDVYVFAAAPQFALLAKNSIGEPVMASPAVADGKLFIRGRSRLFAIGKK